MKWLVLALALCWQGQTNAQQKLVLEGHYRGENIFVQNPFKGGGVGFCTDSIRINGVTIQDKKIHSSAYEIDFTKLGLTKGDSVTVVIYHGNDCTPKVLHTTHPVRTGYRIDTLWIDQNNLVKWRATRPENAGRIPFIVEQYKWNKWVPIGEVVPAAELNPDTTYAFQLVPHSGMNKIRIKQIGAFKKPHLSKAVYKKSDIAPVEMSYDDELKRIQFTAHTSYEVYSEEGNMIKKGSGDHIDLSDLDMKRMNHLFINFDHDNQKLRLK